jgi:hypothetical protein
MAKVCLPYELVLPNSFWNILSDHRSSSQNTDTISRSHHYIHVVLDQNHRAAAAQLGINEIDEALGFCRTHAGCRFVQQQDFGIEG